MNAYLVLIIGWVAYYFLHSWLASAKAKKIFAFKYYRLLYSIFSVTGLLLMLLINGSIQSAYLLPRDGVLRYLSLMLTTFGVIVVRLSFKFKSYSFKSFLGFLPEEPQVLQRGGLLQYVRHPLYSGTILIIVGFFLFIPNWPTLITVTCALLYLPIGIHLEEKKLVALFGEEFIRYRTEVPAIIPNFKNLSA